MKRDNWKPGHYNPGMIAKGFVAVMAIAYLVMVCLDGLAGADLNQQAIVIVILPFILMILPWLAGTLGYFAAGNRQRVGDIAFCVVLLAECVYPYVSRHAS